MGHNSCDPRSQGQFEASEGGGKKGLRQKIKKRSQDIRFKGTEINLVHVENLLNNYHFYLLFDFYLPD